MKDLNPGDENKPHRRALARWGSWTYEKREVVTVVTGLASGQLSKKKNSLGWVGEKNPASELSCLR